MKKVFKSYSTCIFILLLASFPIILSSCFDDIKDAIEQIENELTPIDHISTGLSINVYDYETGEAITDEITIGIHPFHLAKTIDAFSQPLDSIISFEGGTYNLGISNTFIPSASSPERVTFIIGADKYVDKIESINLSDTGMTHFDVRLHHKDRLPPNYSLSEIVAELDEDGNPLPIDLPFDDDQGRTSSAGDENVLIYQYFYPLITKETIWGAASFSSVKGIPSKYSLLGYSWVNDPTLARIYSDPAQPNLTFTKLFELINFEIIIPGQNNDQTFKPISFNTTGIEELSELAISYQILTPDLSPGNTYLNNFLKSSQGNRFRNVAGLVVQYNTGSILMPQWINFDGITENFMKELDPRPFNTNFSQLSMEQPVIYPILFNNQNFPAYRVQSGFKYDANINLPLQKFSVYTLQKLGNIKLKISGYGTPQSMPIEILSGGHTYSGTDTSDDNKASTISNVPLANAQITVKLPEGNFPINYDLTNYSGETITLNVPSKAANLIDASFTINLVCSDSNQKIRFSEIPNTTVRYKKIGTTNWQIAAIKSWNLSSENTLESATILVGAVELNQQYDLKVTVSSFTQSITFTPTSKSISTTATVPFNYCSN